MRDFYVGLRQDGYSKLQESEQKVKYGGSK